MPPCSLDGSSLRVFFQPTASEASGLFAICSAGERVAFRPLRIGTLTHRHNAYCRMAVTESSGPGRGWCHQLVLTTVLYVVAGSDEARSVQGRRQCAKSSPPRQPRRAWFAKYRSAARERGSDQLLWDRSPEGICSVPRIRQNCTVGCHSGLIQ